MPARDMRLALLEALRVSSGSAPWPRVGTVSRAARTAQSEAAEPQDAFEVSEQHLDLLPAMTRTLVGRPVCKLRATSRASSSKAKRTFNLRTQVADPLRTFARTCCAMQRSLGQCYAKCSHCSRCHPEITFSTTVLSNRKNLARGASGMKRREFLVFVGSIAAGSGPFAALAQRASMPVIGFLHSASREPNAPRLAGFRKGLLQAGFVEGQKPLQSIFVGLPGRQTLI